MVRRFCRAARIGSSSFERPGEPPGIHVARTKTATLAAARSTGDDLGLPNELNKVSALVRNHRAEFLKAWHDYFKSGDRSRGGQARSVTEHALVVELRDGRSMFVPIDWYPRLAEGRPSERRRSELIGPGVGFIGQTWTRTFRSRGSCLACRLGRAPHRWTGGEQPSTPGQRPEWSRRAPDWEAAKAGFVSMKAPDIRAVEMPRTIRDRHRAPSRRPDAGRGTLRPLTLTIRGSTGTVDVQPGALY